MTEKFGLKKLDIYIVLWYGLKHISTSWTA